MPVKTKGQDVPRHFPAAKLYLDDIREIIELFSGVLAAQRDVLGEKNSTITTFDLGQQQCDDISELRSIATKCSDFDLEVSRGHSIIRLHIDPSGAWWVMSGGFDEKSWPIATQLQSIFERRKIYSKHFTNSLQAVTLVILGVCPFVLGLFHIPAKMRVLLLIAILVPDMFLFYALAKFRPAVVVFRSRADVTDTREQRAEKFMTIGVTAFVSVVGTLLVQFLIHLLWSH
jgi:hypothetical protein